jgi:hypothetical protein
MSALRDDRTFDLFDDFYRVRRPDDGKAGAFASDAWLRQALSRALKECPLSREEVAAEMGRLLGDPRFSLHMLNRYTAESAEGTRISVIRLLAFIRATSAYWLLDGIARQIGCVAMAGAEAIDAQRGVIRAQIERMQRCEREMKRAALHRSRRRP